MGFVWSPRCINRLQKITTVATGTTVTTAAISFLRTVRPLAREMAFQLSNIKVAWTDKQTKQFRAPHPGQEDGNQVYHQYLKRHRSEDDQSLLEWLRCHSTVGAKAKALGADKYLVAVKFVLPFNPVYFFQHLLVHYPHRLAGKLRHVEQATMPVPIQYFSQALTLRPQWWSRPEQIRDQFQHEGHRTSFVTTLVSYVMALQNVYHLWQRCIVDARISCLLTRSVERLYPMSALQTAVYQDIMDSLAQRQAFVDQHANSGPEIDHCWRKYRVLMGKPGTGKSQVLIRVIHEALKPEASVLFATPVALLAQGYRSIFGADLECDTLHAAFRIPVNDGRAFDVNFALNRFDMVVVDEASLVSPASFNMVAATLNRLNCRPVVIIAGDRRHSSLCRQ